MSGNDLKESLERIEAVGGRWEVMERGKRNADWKLKLFYANHTGC